ncbi:hypothetical protein Tco_0685753 [Tanacetum coccineum]
MSSTKKPVFQPEELRAGVPQKARAEAKLKHPHLKEKKENNICKHCSNEEQLNEELTAKLSFNVCGIADPEEVLGRKLWKEHSQDVIENMHKLPKATYDQLSTIMDIDVHVLRLCVKQLYISSEVLLMRKDHLGNQPETFTEETNEDEYYTDLELSLYKAMQVFGFQGGLSASITLRMKYTVHV